MNQFQQLLPQVLFILYFLTSIGKLLLLFAICLFGFCMNMKHSNYGSMNLNVKCMSYVIYRKKRIIDLPSSSSSPTSASIQFVVVNHIFFILPPSISLTLFLLSQHQIQLWTTHIMSVILCFSSHHHPLYHSSVYFLSAALVIGKVKIHFST